MRKVIWTPQKKQAIFQSRREYEALYGGAAGGGKSDALLTEALRQIRIPHYRALILRKTFPQLSELIDRSQELYKQAFPNAKYNVTDHTWRFHGGAKIIFGSMQYKTDRTNYQGKRYDFIGVDELTHFTWDEYSYMFSRNRSSGPGTRVYIRATCNPGGIGHGWVKNRFITPAPPMTTITETREIIRPDGKVTQMIRDRVFVPSTVFDNEELLKNNPEYVASLSMLPEAEKQALLYGYWDSFTGQVFTEWRNDPAHYGDQRYTHVISRFRIPEHWRVWRGLDWGYAKPYSVGWYAADEEGRLYRIAELYGWNGVPDSGAKEEVTEVGRRIAEMEETHELLKGRKIWGIADPAIFADDGRGQGSIAALLSKNRIYFDPGNNARIPGKMQMHYRLRFDRDGRPMLYVFDTCKQFIRTIPELVYDAVNVEDVNTKHEDHIYDECRYILMENPITPRPEVVTPIPKADPLNMFADTWRI